MEKTYMNEYDKKWFKNHWRPLCAAIYLFICTFDFVIMPAIVEINNEKDQKLTTLVEEVQKIGDKDVQLAIVNKAEVEDRTWKPLTLAGGAFFHIAFGTILTGAAVTRGLERQALAKGN